MSSHLHPDGKSNPHDSVCNRSGNASILDVIEQRQVSRRGFLKTSLGATAATLFGASVVDGVSNEAEAGHRRGRSAAIGFAAVPANVVPMADAVTVPHGYSARTLVAWGDSLSPAAHWDSTGAMDEATQLRTFGSHIDGMHYFPFRGRAGNQLGLLVTNHEYCDPPLVNNIVPASSYATAPMTLEMVRAQQAAHGVAVVTVGKGMFGTHLGVWEVVRQSPFNRRITANSPCQVRGPAAGDALMKSFKFDIATATQIGVNDGYSANGTLNNCAHGYTPWGTYLTCEENWNGYFAAPTGGVEIDPNLFDQKGEILQGKSRYGISKTGFGYRWHEADPRFNADTNPLEPNLFGWVVEIDPFDPHSVPVKRTAMGRFKHESAQVVVDKHDRVAFYMGDDERNEYIYKYVCARPMTRRNPAANRDMLDDGILYVAKFNADGSGEWLPLVWGQSGLTSENGFASQAEVLIKTRQAADRLGATMMDRPEWAAADPRNGDVYITLTNNSRRGNTPASSNKADGTSNSASANPPVDAANPRPDNDFGHILRWRETRRSVAATTFEWDIFVQCGDKSTAKTLGASYDPAGHDGYVGNINGDDYGAPDGLWFDDDGRLWIQTDQQGDAKGDWANIGGNVMMCADVHTGETRRFLTSPPNCEVTGVIATPDGRTMFVGIQHPGEDWKDSPTDNSAWPDNGANGPTTHNGSGAAKPRSAVVVITKDDGGVIGT
ncbi:MAG: PhoX family phosphatase [Thiotrichales bacterium]